MMAGNCDVTADIPTLNEDQKGERKPTKATNIPNRTSIHDRPSEADGKRFGDFEMDLIVDATDMPSLYCLNE